MVHVNPLSEEVLRLLVETWGVPINVSGLDNSSVHHTRGSFQSCCLIHEDKIRVDKGTSSGGAAAAASTRGAT